MSAWAWYQPVLTERSVYVSIGGMPMDSTADAVVVGGGTIGAWCAYFLRTSGVDRVILLDKDRLGQGASSRAAGIVRTQGGTALAGQLGEGARPVYLSEADLLCIHSGFAPQGDMLPCFV